MVRLNVVVVLALGVLLPVPLLGAGKPVFDFAEVGPEAYRPLRRELRAFHPDECHGKCRRADVLASHQKMRDEVKAWAAAHPGYDALDVRREHYRALARHFVPVTFTNSPFYFEAGVNGGWVESHNPARVVDSLCWKFYREQGLVPDEIFKRSSELHRQRYSLVCGPLVDNMHHVAPLRTILKKGFRGVRDEVAAALATCPANDPLGRKELETALVGLDTIHELQRKFTTRYDSPWEPPKTFLEGLNALWFVREMLALTDGVDIYELGRADHWLYDLYKADLAAGRITEESARDLVRRFMIHSDCHHDGAIPVDSYSDHEAEMPLTLGGCDEDGRPVWNELTRMFLEEHQRMGLVFPKMHVRFSRNSPREYLELIAQQVLDGHAVFAMFNDDTTIPSMERLGVPTPQARDYVCCGCWDPAVDSLFDQDDANYMSVIRVIEATIYQDREEMARAGLRMDPIDGCETYEEVERVFMANFLRFFRDVCSMYTRYGRSGAKVFPHPAYTMCMEGGIASRRDTTDGGLRFRPKVMTLAFLANAVDSMCAIRRVVFERRFCTLGEFLSAVRGNWQGERAQAIRAEVLKSPSWGDNSAESNALMKKWIDTVADDIDGLKNDQGGPYVLACWIYREFMYWGEKTRATPDGRYDGERLAQGFAPSEYRNRSGVADIFNALGSLDHSRLYASNANLMFGGEGFDKTHLGAIFAVFAEKGGHLLQPNCCDVETLRDAQVHPERHQDLMVKVCGFSARFISLSKRWQDEVIARHRLR